MTDQSKTLTYGIPRPRRAPRRPAARSDEHDELLFIVVHQVYELWFKQLLHELDRVRTGCSGDGRPHRALHTLKRILTILKVVVAQIDILETMTPRQFLASAAGSRRRAASSRPSSASSRSALGPRDRERARAYRGGQRARRRMEAAFAEPSLWDAFLRYLARKGYAGPRRRPSSATSRPPVAPRRTCRRLLVDVYRERSARRPGLRAARRPRRGLQEWRYRHVKMVERTIGDQGRHRRLGRRAIPAHDALAPLFPDLWAIRASCDRARRRSPLVAERPRAPLLAFRVAERLLLTGHSHQAWPDVALEGQREAFDDAAALRRREMGRAPSQGGARASGLPAAARRRRGDIALAPNTHELVTRWLSALAAPDAPAPRHLRRRVPHDPPAARLGSPRRARRRAACPPRPADDARRSTGGGGRRPHERGARLGGPLRDRPDRARPRRPRRARARAHGAELLVDAYHALNVVPFASPSSASAAPGSSAAATSTPARRGQLLPARAAAAHELRPVLTGWFAEFDELEAEATGERVSYGHRRRALRRRDLRPHEPLPRRARLRLLRGARPHARVSPSRLAAPGRTARRGLRRAPATLPSSRSAASWRSNIPMPSPFSAASRARESSPTRAAATCGSAPPRTCPMPSSRRPSSAWERLSERTILAAHDRDEVPPAGIRDSRALVQHPGGHAEPGAAGAPPGHRGACRPRRPRAALPHGADPPGGLEDAEIPIPDAVSDVYRLWRPTPLYRAHRLERELGTGSRIFYKYEGVSPAGSHKPNTAVAQAYYAKEDGRTGSRPRPAPGSGAARSPSPRSSSGSSARSTWSGSRTSKSPTGAR